MSFNTYARQIRQPERSLAQRRVTFGACIKCYCYLCHQSHQAIWARFADEFGFNEKVPDANERILRALDALEKERAQKLEKLRVFDMKRVRAEMRGRRTLSNAERERLDAIRRGE